MLVDVVSEDVSTDGGDDLEVILGDAVASTVLVPSLDFEVVPAREETVGGTDAELAVVVEAISNSLYVHDKPVGAGIVSGSACRNEALVVVSVVAPDPECNDRGLFVVPSAVPDSVWVHEEPLEESLLRLVVVPAVMAVITGSGWADEELGYVVSVCDSFWGDEELVDAILVSDSVWAHEGTVDVVVVSDSAWGREELTDVTKVKLVICLEVSTPEEPIDPADPTVADFDPSWFDVVAVHKELFGDVERELVVAVGSMVVTAVSVSLVVMSFSLATTAGNPR
jgi:hypothetical protein